MLIAALSTGHKVGLGLVGLAFVVFALISAFLLPALRPDYPGKRGLPAFLTLSVTLFVGMMFAVFFFGRETSEGHAAEGSKAAATTTPSQTTTPSTAAPSTTESTTTAPVAPKSVAVTEVEFNPKFVTLDEGAKGEVQFSLWFDTRDNKLLIAEISFKVKPLQKGQQIGATPNLEKRFQDILKQIGNDKDPRSSKTQIVYDLAG